MPTRSADPQRPAWYAARRGGWRDWWTLLHPPYTLWHLSYVAIGAALAPRFDAGRLWASLAAFLLALGVAAHALDELRDRPLGTALSDRALVAAASTALAGAVAIGGVTLARIDPGPVFAASAIGLMGLGVWLVLAYDLEWLDGRVHTDTGFALAWGAYPAVVGHVAQAETLTPAGALVAGAAYALSRAQRSLSTPARDLRRRTRDVRVDVTGLDGRPVSHGAAYLLTPIEGALRTLSAAVVLLAVALTAHRLGV